MRLHAKPAFYMFFRDKCSIAYRTVGITSWCLRSFCAIWVSAHSRRFVDKQNGWIGCDDFHRIQSFDFSRCIKCCSTCFCDLLSCQLFFCSGHSSADIFTTLGFGRRDCMFCERACTRSLHGRFRPTAAFNSVQKFIPVWILKNKNFIAGADFFCCRYRLSSRTT